MQEHSRRNKDARQKQAYNHSSGSKSFLQRQHKLAKQQGYSLSGNEICEVVLGRQPGLLKRSWLRTKAQVTQKLY